MVVDLEGLGKGYAWVNGNNIGRYWPSYLAGEDGCSDVCNYRGEYTNTKCVFNCGQPTQKWLVNFFFQIKLLISEIYIPNPNLI